MELRWFRDSNFASAKLQVLKDSTSMWYDVPVVEAISNNKYAVNPVELSSKGNVGIQGTTPTTKLEVNSAATHQLPEGKTLVPEHRPNFDGRNNVIDRKKVGDELTSMYVPGSAIKFLMSNKLGKLVKNNRSTSFKDEFIWEWNYSTLKTTDIEVLKFLIVQLKIHNDD
tara:strand:- start:110 stop:616 length:507 start_codon:yes stop_codon:yes gene_type:complete